MTCTDHFHTLLGWELDYQLYDVHHLLVVGYHLQHPYLYSPEGLTEALYLLRAFVVEGRTPQEVRPQIRRQADPRNQTHKITGSDDAYGQYAHPVTWTIRVGDIVAGGVDQYYARVQSWAESVYHALRDSGNVSEV